MTIRELSNLKLRPEDEEGASREPGEENREDYDKPEKIYGPLMDHRPHRYTKQNKILFYNIV